jgi:hypothetical protein
MVFSHTPPAIITAAFVKSLSMLKSIPAPDTGKILLKAVKEGEAKALAVRTALAVERYQSSSTSEPEILSGEQVSGQGALQASIPSGGDLWTRHELPTSNLLVFSRREGEILTIRRSSTSDGWIINYDEPVEDWPL